MAVSLQQIVIFHGERSCCILLPRNIIFFHEIITEFYPIFQFYQTIRLLEGDLLDKIKLSVFCGKQNADMTDKKRIIRIRKFVMQNDGDQASAIPCTRALTCSVTSVLFAAFTGANRAQNLAVLSPQRTEESAESVSRSRKSASSPWVFG